MIRSVPDGRHRHWRPYEAMSLLQYRGSKYGIAQRRALTFRLLYCFFIIDHRRRKILHFNVTAHPTAEWVCQQLREAFPEASSYKHAILDRDTKFSAVVVDLLKSSGIEPKRTSFRSPWQNGVSERWVGSARRECFDHLIAQRIARSTDGPGIRQLLPRRPHEPRARQRYSAGQGR